jgi:glycine oxidase
MIEESAQAGGGWGAGPVGPAEITPTEPDTGNAGEGSSEAMSSTISMKRDRPTVAIVGGGVIGLSIGWRLAAAGCEVDIFERAEAGHGASRAAAGMLSAGLEVEPGGEALLALARRSQALWPGFARVLTSAAGMDVGYRDEGTLAVALTRDDAEQLSFTVAFQRRLGIAIEMLTGTAARDIEPRLHPGIVSAARCGSDHQVDNRRVVMALKRALAAAGGRLHEQCEAGLDMAAGRLAGLVVGDRSHRAEIVVIAAGAWSRSVAGLPAELRPPVRPIKGQMLALKMAADDPLVRHVIWSPRAYFVPRRDGRLLVGATVEERGFDPSVTAGAIYALLESARRTIPSVEDLAIDEIWCGFRPGSRDDAPILGPTAIDGLVMATGHHRSGILLTPITAAAITDYVLSGIVPEEIRPFGLDRFRTRHRAMSEMEES